MCYSNMYSYFKFHNILQFCKMSEYVQPAVNEVVRLAFLNADS